RLMFTAQLDGMGPWVIRYPRGCGVKEEWQCPLEKVEPGTGRKLKDGDDVAVLTLGPIGNDVAEAIAETEGSGATTKTAAHYDMRFVKPLDEKLLDEIGRKFKEIVTVEDGARNGGFGSAVMEWLQDHGYTTRVKRMGMPDHFVEHGTIAELREIIGMDKASIINTIYK
ncbi:MAG: transketolase C-terminal domain-containing protein, partial [Prevotella sp.]